MEGRICCAYNVTRSCEVSPKVTVVEKTDQPLTILRMLVEGLGFKAATGLWLNPLHGPPQLVRPFPFDLVYLDENRQVLEAVELLPEVSFPRFDDRTTSALILPVRTISSTGIQKGDELAVCAKDELEDRLAANATQSALVAVSSASGSATREAAVATLEAEAPAALIPDVELSTAAEDVAVEQTDEASDAEAASVAPLTPAAPIIPVHPQVFFPMATGTTAQGTAFTPTLATTWQVRNAAAVVKDSAQPAETDVPVPIAVESPAAAGADAEAFETPAEENAPEAAQLSASPKQAVSSTAEAVSAAADQHPQPALGSTDGAVYEAPPVQPETIPVPGVERPVSAEADSPLSKPITPRPAAAPPEPVQVAKPNIAKAPAASTQKPVAPARNAESPREKASRAVRTAPAETEQSGTKASEKKKKKSSFGDLVKDFLNCPDPPPEYRDAARLVQQGMIAQDRTDTNSAWIDVRDVSPSGCYLRTKSPWKVGDIVSLSLQRKGATEEEFESHVDVQGKVVRCDEGGVGLVWAFPAGLKFQPWDRLHTKRSDESDIHYFIREMRFAKAMHFLQRICPLASQEIRHAFVDRLSNKRVSSAVEIALQAEKALARTAKGKKVLAHSDVLMKIIESGSWIEDNWIRKMWAGLLVSSCDADGQDTSNLTFIDLLARLTPMHLRILSFVCRKFDDAVAAGAAPAKLDVYCTAEELTIAADSHSFARIQQTVGQLSGVGLLVESARPSYFSVSDKEKTRTTPTTLGLKMYARCHGRRI